jgi:NAD(P)H-nitrite reductase large subunit
VNYLIVGNSAAAIGAVEAIRPVDPEGTITLVAAESEHTYSRPLISYLLAGKVDEAGMGYRPADFYESHRVETILGDEVVKVDPETKTATTASGRELPYDKLLLATGGKPFVPPIPGAEGVDGIFTFTEYEDARRVESLLQKETVRQAVVLGGGMIGLKVAEALIARGLKVTIVELADRLLANTFDKTASVMLEEALKGKGAAVCLETTIEKVDSNQGRLRGVMLASGHEIYCRALVVAIGVRPNMAYLEGTGVETNRGIVVDNTLRTSHPDIYAAGDVAEAYDLLLGQKRPIPILPLAYRQGMIAGRNMAGLQDSYVGGMAMNSIEICDLPTISVGITAVSDGEDGYEVLTSKNDEKNTYKKVVLKGNRMVGAILVGDIDRAGIYTGLIERGEDVAGIKKHLLSDQFGLMSLDPEYRKHMVSGPGIEV